MIGKDWRANRNGQKYVQFWCRSVQQYVEFGTEGAETLRNMQNSAPKVPKRSEI